ncbi:MAG: Z1 domain-containing protein [Balneolales bacterium]|nr:Z1 domain-containing protein [Balneolales bacterium]
MIEQAIRILRVMLGNKSTVTKEQIESNVDQVLQMPSFSLIERNRLIREVESIYSVRVEDYRIIERDERRKPWLNSKKSVINWDFWSRYQTYLQDERNFAPDTVTKLDRLTDKILDSLFDPTEKVQVDKKGLVVGQVQSGKTSNYSGLICKAADAGFKLIIVLAGIHNNLRSQTQLRLDEGFLGFDTQHTRAFNQNNIKIGVGRINRSSIAHSLTSSLDRGDFTSAAANAAGFNFDTNEPIIAVVKKNPHVLRRLYQWLSAQGFEEENGIRKIRNKSLLLIDDEADNASINISNDPELRSTINRWITDIIGLFSKSGYVGYTATPFANIFIPISDYNLFPRDFIVNIPAPSNYIGPEKIFGFQLEEEDSSESVLPIVHRIDDYHTFVPDRHKKGEYPDWKKTDDVTERVLNQFFLHMPDSLKLAVRCFILTCTVRRLRGQENTHNSMLVHVTRFQNWQSIITASVQKLFDFYRMGINQNDPEIVELFQSTFEEDRNGYKSYLATTKEIMDSSHGESDPKIQLHSWAEVLGELNNAVSRIEVRAIHGGSGEVLDYYDHKDGLSVIAVGGNKLSRGLTLEGLSVSYYLRASRMYDTLMQMGRWFGFRPGYVDLCRLFTSRELNEWFCHITHASEELREEFDYMSDVAGSTPEQYALKVRNHPGVLQISATNKLRSAVNIQVTWAGRLVESYEISKDANTVKTNLVATEKFIQSLTPEFHMKKGNYLWYDISAELIIDFLSKIRTPENLKAYDPQNLIRFINLQLTNQELTNWSVALISSNNASVYHSMTIVAKEINIGCSLRRQDKKNSDQEIYYMRKSHIISPKDEFLDLSDDQYLKGMQLTSEMRARLNKEGEPKYPNGEIVRNQIRSPQNPLLLIYLLDPCGAYLPKGFDPIMGYAISFPGSNYNSNVTYSVNEQLMDRFNIDEVNEDFEDYED